MTQISEVLLLSTLLALAAASPTLLGMPGISAGFGFETSSITDNSGQSGSCFGDVGFGQYALPSSQCVYGSCMLLNASSIICTRPNGGLSTEAYTVAAWLSPYTAVSIQATLIFFNVWSLGGSALQFGINSSSIMFPDTSRNVPLMYNGSTPQTYINGSSYRFPFVVAPSAWVHVAFVYNGAYVRLYINGTLQSAFMPPSNVTDLTSSAYTYNIGSTAGLSAAITPFQGFIDELGIFSIALDAAQIFALYDVANPAPTSAPTNVPIAGPTRSPTNAPSSRPTTKPSSAPSAVPSIAPTPEPSVAHTATPTSSSKSVSDYLMHEGSVTIAIWVSVGVLFLTAVWLMIRCCRCCGCQEHGVPYDRLPGSSSSSNVQIVQLSGR